MKRPELLIFALACLACRSPGPRLGGPRLRPELPSPKEPHAAPHGFARYSGGLRVLESAEGEALTHIPGVFETLARRYRCREAVELRLIPAIRFARPEYYTRLRAELAPCRRVLHDEQPGFERRPSRQPPIPEGLQGARENWTSATRPPTLPARSLPRLRELYQEMRVESWLFPPSREPEEPLEVRLHFAALALTGLRRPNGSPPAPPELLALDPEAFRAGEASPEDRPGREPDALIEALERVLDQPPTGPIAVVLGLARAAPIDRLIRSRFAGVILLDERGEERWLRAWTCRGSEPPPRRSPGKDD